MRIKRLTLTLPPRMRHTAHHEARAIAEAVAQALSERGTPPGEIRVPGHGQSGAVLAQRVGAALPRRTGGTGHGG